MIQHQMKSSWVAHGPRHTSLAYNSLVFKNRMSTPKTEFRCRSMRLYSGVPLCSTVQSNSLESLRWSPSSVRSPCVYSVYVIRYMLFGIFYSVYSVYATQYMLFGCGVYTIDAIVLPLIFGQFQRHIRSDRVDHRRRSPFYIDSIRAANIRQDIVLQRYSQHSEWLAV